MYLKRLELQGFKSFAPRTVLEFSPGITAIVGPNGSGKSNISDAIRWVLGEQSMRQLRGKKSDDIIFAGGQGRAPMHMAEVTLVLDNSAGWLPSDHTEVTAARRIYRSGESEYLMAGQRVRLRDLLLLLAQARIGHDSYTVVGQGLVDQALSLRAEERRGLFEDAAGIRQFQSQRSDAEQKLTLTQTNLARLRDILGEIEPRLGPLAEQARRARDYVGARDDLRRQLRTWYTWQWAELAAAREQTGVAETATAARIESIRAGLQNDDQLLQQTRTARDEIAARIAALRRTRGETIGRVQALERELAVGQERRASLERQAADLDGEQGTQESATLAIQHQINTLEAQLSQTEEQASALAREIEQAESAQHTARQVQEREEARLRAAQRDVIQAQARLGAAQSELGRLQKQLGERNRALASRQETTGAAQRRLDAASAAHEQQQGAFEDARASVEALVAQREELARAIVASQTEAEQARTALADTQREHRALTDRLALLEEWRRSLDGYSDGARALVQAPAHDRPPAINVLARLIQVREGYEAAIEGALGPFLHAVVVPSRDDARACARWLRDRQAGHTVLLWRSDISEEAAPPAINVPGDHQRFGPALGFVDVEPTLRPLLARLLAGVHIVPDLNAAEQALKASRDDTALGTHAPRAFATLDGEVLYGDDWLRGGAMRRADAVGHTNRPSDTPTPPREAPARTVLQRERELRELPASIARQEGQIAAHEAAHTRILKAQAERRIAADGVERQMRQAEAHAQELARQVAALQRDQERAQGELQLSQAVADQLSAEIQGLDQEVAASMARVAEQEARQQETQEIAANVQDMVDEFVATNREQQEALARQRTAAAVRAQEAKALGQQLDQHRAHLAELEQQIARRGERVQSILALQDEVDRAATAQQAALDELRADVRQRTIELGEREAALAHAEGTLTEVERDQAVARQELSAVETEYRRCMVEAQRARDAVDALASQIHEELVELGELDEQTTIEDVAALFDGIAAGANPSADDDATDRLKPEEAARLRRQLDQLRSRLRQLGGYDPDAPQAYEELKTRRDFLSGQVRDMEQGASNLRTIIAELDATMRRQFAETFAAVNLRFQRHFTTLFSGGSARLELTAPHRPSADDDEDAESAEQTSAPAPKSPSFGGVEVFVQIPGKRVQDLVLLSGGERAMVSAALLFALLETNPPPFCLLDEVDAALDAANVVRFCEILKQLAEHTQFMVITHNQVTMTFADALYGISMREDSVSNVLSMQMSEVAVAQ